MLDGRLYRAALLPLLPVLVVVAFSLTAVPQPLTATLPSNLFMPGEAYSLLSNMAAQYPDRRPGSSGDLALASYVANALRNPQDQPVQQAPGPCGTASTFCVRTVRFRAQTIDGSRELENVIATRPGSNPDQIVVIAHRDAAAPGSRAELSGTAALIELGNVLSGRVTKHTITLISTDGGSGGAAGAARLASEVQGPVDAVIVLGDLAGRSARTPFVIGWSDGGGGAPPLLVQTIKAAIDNQVGIVAGTPSFVTQFAHHALPFAVGEEGVLNAQGIPAALVQVSGEQGPAPDEPISQARLGNFGAAALTALDALDVGPDIPQTGASDLELHGKLIPSWAVRLLVAMLLLPVLVVTLDALARVRRRRDPVLVWLRWVLSCALPFFVCAIAAVLLARSGELATAPAEPVLPRALPAGAGARAPLILAALVLVLGWMAWTSVAVLLDKGRPLRPRTAGAGVAWLLVLSVVAVVVWIANPFAALLLVPALHFALLLACPDLRPRPPFGVVLVVLALALPGAVIALYAHQLGIGPLQAAWTALLLVAGGHVGLASAAVWSLCLGCTVAGLLLALCGHEPVAETAPATPRGSLHYTGPAPGALGESALRREWSVK